MIVLVLAFIVVFFFLNDAYLFRNAYYGISFRLSSTRTRPKGLMEETVYGSKSVRSKVVSIETKS